MNIRNNKSAYTLIEVMVGIAIIFILCEFIAFIFFSVNRDRKPLPCKVGEFMYIDGLNITGKVNKVTWRGFSTDVIVVDLLVNNTNGLTTIIQNVDFRNVKKIQSIEK
jgi:hypothetical protein